MSFTAQLKFSSVNMNIKVEKKVAAAVKEKKNIVKWQYVA